MLTVDLTLSYGYFDAANNKKWFITFENFDHPPFFQLVYKVKFLSSQKFGISLSF